MTKDEIKKAYEICASANDCSSCNDCPDCANCASAAALNLISEQEKEIERLKAENEELTKVVSSKVYDLIDNAKEIADAREAWEKQAKIDLLKELIDGYGQDYISHVGLEKYKVWRVLKEIIEELQND